MILVQNINLIKMELGQQHATKLNMRQAEAGPGITFQSPGDHIWLQNNPLSASGHCRRNS